jgi:hypothetical protein
MSDRTLDVLNSGEEDRLLELRKMPSRTNEQELEMQRLIARQRNQTTRVTAPQSVGQTDQRVAGVPLFALNKGAPEVLPVYRSRAVVSAIQITGVTMQPNGGATLALGDKYAPWDAGSIMVRHYPPERGDYLVVHPDGTNVLMSAPRFEAEYEGGGGPARAALASPPPAPRSSVVPLTSADHARLDALRANEANLSAIERNELAGLVARE